MRIWAAAIGGLPLSCFRFLAYFTNYGRQWYGLGLRDEFRREASGLRSDGHRERLSPHGRSGYEMATF
jgi:hypothetical protein